ncbi:hypothetical protein C0J52_28051 [Blattella germanica]|nr:hypothetical protein C0J52_28051 [Blattella germanica]
MEKNCEQSVFDLETENEKTLPSECGTTPQTTVGDESTITPQPYTHSASENKLKLSVFSAVITPDTPHTDFSLVHVSLWEELYKGMKCTYCDKINLKTEATDHLGFYFKIKVKCNDCSSIIKEIGI